MSITRTNDGANIRMEVPHSLGFTMIWDSFKCELKSARVCGPVTSIGRKNVKNARLAAQLMITLNGKQAALPLLRSIARHVAMEVRR